MNTTITIAGHPVRTCKGEQIGEREGQRLFVLDSPYDWPTAHTRMALVDKDNVAYRIWPLHSSPKWAREIFRLLFENSIYQEFHLPLRRRKEAPSIPSLEESGQEADICGHIRP